METILVIDDDPASSAVCKALFASAYSVILTKSGLQALGYLKENPSPELILLDGKGHGLNGMEVLQQLKASPKTSSIPVIVLTSSQDMNFIVECYSNGATDISTKPLLPVLISKKVEYVLEYQRLLKENKHLREEVLILEALRQRPKYYK